jgi:hypothetical protein
MRRRRLFLLLFGCVVAGIIVLMVWPKRTSEPEYKGKRLSEWLALYLDGGSVGKQEASDAVHAIGTNALPWLLNRVRNDPSKTGWPKTASVARKLPGHMGRSVAEWLDEDSNRRLQLTQAGFHVLGPSASAAIPELSWLLGGSDFNASARASSVMRYLGKEALPPLLSVIQDRRAPIGKRIPAASALRYMGYLGVDAAPAVPVLVACLNDTNRTLSFFSAQALGNFALESGTVVPALTNQIHSSDLYVRRFVVRALGQYGSNAIVALPLVLKALGDSDQRVRVEATNAFRRIAPELAQTNGVSSSR